MKKILQFSIIITMTAALLAGCSAQNGSGGTSTETPAQPPANAVAEKESLTLWYWINGIDESLFPSAEALFDIQLNAEPVGGDFLMRVTTTLAGDGELPDILLLNDWVITLMPHADKFTNLLDYGAADIKDLYYEWKWNTALTPDGESLIALPIDTAPTALFYRADLFEQAGLPHEPADVAQAFGTWESIFEANAALRAHTGAYLFDNIEMVFMQSLAQIAGNHFFDADDHFIGDGAHVRAAFDNAVQSHERGVLMGINNWTPEWNAAINNGHVAAFVGGVWMQGVLRDSAPDTSGLWRVAMTPGGPGNQGGSFIAVPANARNTALAVAVAKWLVNPENNINNFVNRGIFPSTPGAFDDDRLFVPDPFFGGQATAHVFKETVERMPLFYMAPRHNIFRDFFTNELYLVADIGKNPGEAWNDAVQAAWHELERTN